MMPKAPYLGRSSVRPGVHCRIQAQNAHLLISGRCGVTVDILRFSTCSSSLKCSHCPPRTAHHTLLPLPQACMPCPVLSIFTQAPPTMAYLLGRLAGHLIQPPMSSGQDRAGGRVTHHCSICSTASPPSWTLDLDAVDSQNGLGADASPGPSPSEQPQESCPTVLGLS